jgi:hypothetical protein
MSGIAAIRRDLARGRTLRANNCPIDYTDHAFEQSNRRHFRRLDIERAEHELYARIEESGLVCAQAPGWIFKRRTDERVVAWLVLEWERLCWPLYEATGPQAGSLTAGTCLSPTSTPVGASVRFLVGAHAGHRAGRSS